MLIILHSLPYRDSRVDSRREHVYTVEDMFSRRERCDAVVRDCRADRRL